MSATKKTTAKAVGSKGVMIDPDKLSALLGKMIEDKINQALGAGNVPQAVTSPEKVEVPAPAKTVSGAIIKLGDIEINLDAVSSRGTRYRRNIKGYLVDKRTGVRYYLRGDLFPARDDKIADDASFIAEIR